jgi:hypothetical protein
LPIEISPELSSERPAVRASKPDQPPPRAAGDQLRANTAAQPTTLRRTQPAPLEKFPPSRRTGLADQLCERCGLGLAKFRCKHPVWAADGYAASTALPGSG